MIKAKRGFIHEVKGVNYICSVANSFGPMVSSVAKAIKASGGKQIEDESFYVCNKVKYQAGDIFVTKSGNLPYEKIFHIVSTNYPNEKTSYEIIEKCVSNLVPYCKMMGVKELAVPSLGIGVGELGIDQVSDLYKKILGKEKDVIFHIVDTDPVFIYQFVEYM